MLNEPPSPTRDLMHSAEIKALVREAYRQVPPTTEAVARKFYSAQELAQVPAARTGPTGRVIALDFLPEMLQRTADAAAEAGLNNVEVLEGELESIPLPDSSVDLIISNGVVNLSPRKSRVMAECARVLRPGGRLCVSDLTVEQETLPPEILAQPAAWAGCVAGALAEAAFVRKLAKAGLADIAVIQREPLGIADCALYPLFSDEVIRLMTELLPTQRHGEVAVSIVVTATLPL